MNELKDVPKWQKIVCTAISIFVFLVIWYLGTNGTRIGQIMANPVEVLKKFFQSIIVPIGTHTLTGHILWSLSRVMIAFIIASGAGITLGVTMGWYKTIEAIFRPLFEVIRPIPPIAWIPLAILWFGLGESPKYFIIFLAAFANITINAYAGAKSVDPVLVGAARMLGASERMIFTSIVLPASVPYIFAGMQIAMSSAWATVVAAEMVRSSEGVGWVIITGQDANNTVQILVGIIAVGLIGYLLAIVMRGIEAKLCAWSVRGT